MADTGGSPDVKVALVPFEGDVNVGPSVVDAAYAGNPPAWLDWSNQAKAKYNGQNFDKYDFVADAPCTTGTNCKIVGHKWLFDKLTAKDANVKWAGCVEMRAEPYDLTDSMPSASVPDTLFVPRFWPDEPDNSNDDGDNYQNNYLNDKMTGSAAGCAEEPDEIYQLLARVAVGQKDTTYPYRARAELGLSAADRAAHQRQGHDRYGDRRHDRLLLDGNLHPDRARVGLARPVADRAVHRGHPAGRSELHRRRSRRWCSSPTARTSSPARTTTTAPASPATTTPACQSAGPIGSAVPNAARPSTTWTPRPPSSART